TGTVTNANVTDVKVICGQDPGIRCGSDLSCAEGTFCCLNRGAGTGVCVPNGGSCGETPISCDDAFHCGGANVCCARYTRTNGPFKDFACQSSCQNAGNNPVEIWCDPVFATAPCPGALTCTGTAATAGYHKCQ